MSYLKRFVQMRASLVANIDDQQIRVHCNRVTFNRGGADRWTPSVRRVHNCQYDGELHSDSNNRNKRGF